MHEIEMIVLARQLYARSLPRREIARTGKDGGGLAARLSIINALPLLEVSDVGPTLDLVGPRMTPEGCAVAT